MSDLVATFILVSCALGAMCCIALALSIIDYRLAKRASCLSFRLGRRLVVPSVPPPIPIPELEAEAAASEVGYFSVRDHVLHVRQFEERSRYVA